MEKLPFSVYDFFAYLSSGFLVVFAAVVSLNGVAPLQGPLPVVFLIFWILFAYLVGHMVAHFSAIVLEDALVRGLLGSPNRHLFAEKRPRSLRAFLFRGHFTPLPASMVKRFKDKAATLGIPLIDDGFFFHCYSRVKQRDYVSSRLSAFLNLYGFCRNLSMALLIVSFTLGIRAYRDPATILYHLSLSCWAWIFLGLSLGMLYRYLKFYRLYSVEVFLSFDGLDGSVKGGS